MGRRKPLPYSLISSNKYGRYEVDQLLISAKTKG